MKKILVLMLAGSLLFANNAFAGRFGGGKNSGMQRSITTTPPTNANSGFSKAAPTNPQQQGSRGMGLGTAAMLGAAAGAAGGYMLGKNSNNSPNASGAVTSEARSAIPWGTILILIAILAIGLMFFRKKTNPGLSSSNPINNFTSQGRSNFNIPGINRTPDNTQTNKAEGKPIIKFGSAAPVVVNEQLDKMPDGIETIYFLRQAKGMFLHIQSMNNLENLDEIQKYMTPQLFAETKYDIETNPAIADFSNLNCQLISCEAIEATQTDDGQVTQAQLIASVKFFGNVSDAPDQAPQPFSEIWNFIKSPSTNNKWIVAGIQQESAKTE